MKSFIALSAVLAVAFAYPTKIPNNYQLVSNNNYAHAPVQSQSYEQSQKQVPIVKYQAEQGQDSYNYGYESGNGIVAAESGVLKNAGQKNAAFASEGFYSYPGTDGRTYAVKYTADENGFRATGDHLPTPPPIPAEIQEGLAKIAANPKQYQQEDQYYQENSNSNAHLYAQIQPRGSYNHNQIQKW